MTAAAYRTKDIDGDYRREPKTNVFCARCHKDLKLGQKRRGVHMVDGGAMVLHPEDEAIYAATPGVVNSDMGFWMVGMDCARKIGMAWTHPVAADELVNGAAR